MGTGSIHFSLSEADEAPDGRLPDSRPHFEAEAAEYIDDRKSHSAPQADPGIHDAWIEHRTDNDVDVLVVAALISLRCEPRPVRTGA
jgi:hypothetical protein